MSMACILLWSCAVRVHDSHTGRRMWQRSASVVSWSWEKYPFPSKLVSALSMLLFSVLSWSVSQAWNPHQLWLSPGTWSLWLSQASVHLFWSLCWCHRCCLSSAWSSQHWSPCHRLWRLCRGSLQHTQKWFTTTSSKSCMLDPIPTSLVKKCLNDLVPLVTATINVSFYRYSPVGCGGFVETLN